MSRDKNNFHYAWEVKGVSCLIYSRSFFDVFFCAGGRILKISLTDIRHDNYHLQDVQKFHFVEYNQQEVQSFETNEIFLNIAAVHSTPGCPGGCS